MPDIETLVVLTINDKTIGRQLASGEIADKRQRNCQCERAIHTGGGKLESCTKIGRMLMHKKQSRKKEGSL